MASILLAANTREQPLAYFALELSLARKKASIASFIDFKGLARLFWNKQTNEHQQLFSHRLPAAGKGLRRIPEHQLLIH